MVIQKATIPMDKPFDQGKRPMQVPQAKGMIAANKKAK